MEAKTGRHEEFGASPWAVAALGLFLAAATVSPLFHHNAAPRPHPAPAPIVAQAARPSVP